MLYTNTPDYLVQAKAIVDALGLPYTQEEYCRLVDVVENGLRKEAGL